MRSAHSSVSPEPKRLPDGRIEIEAWFPNYPFPTYDGREFTAPLRDRVAEFEEKHPEYRVVVGTPDFPEVPGRVRQAVAAGRVPALVGYYTADSGAASETRAADGSPLFTGIERAVGGRTEILGEPVVLDDLLPVVREYHSRDGELLSAPLSVTTVVGYANATALRAAGVPHPPRTRREVVETCRAVVGSRTGPSHGITWANDGWLVQQGAAVPGGCLIEPDNGRSGGAPSARPDAPGVVEWVRWWRELHRAGHYLYTGGPSDWGGSLNAFLDGRVALLLDSSKSAEEIVRAGAEAGFEVEVFPMPAPDGADRTGHPIAGDSLWLTDCLHPLVRDGALALVQHLLSPRSLAAWHRLNGFVPPTVAAGELLAAEGWFEDRPYRRTAGGQLRSADLSPHSLGPVVGELPAVLAEITRAVDEILREDHEPAGRLALAAEAAGRLLAGASTVPARA